MNPRRLNVAQPSLPGMRPSTCEVYRDLEARHTAAREQWRQFVQKNAQQLEQMPSLDRARMERQETARLDAFTRAITEHRVGCPTCSREDVGAGVQAPSAAANRLLDASEAIRQEPDAAELAYMARQLVQCTLPHSDPGNVPLWTRRNGALTLTIEPYTDRKTLKHLYPCGSIPRLLLFWLVTEATRTRSRHIRLGNSLDSFMREIGLNPRTGGGKRGDAKRLALQMERLFRCTVSFEDERQTHKSWVDMRVAPKAVLWWDPSRSLQDNLWDSWVDLGEEFFDAITAAPVPVDYRALRALKRSPLALDLYAWATYTAFSATRRRQTRTIPWDALHAQMGAEYGEVRRFRQSALAALRKIQTVYPALRVENTPAGLIVRPSASAISPRI